jgi:thiamine biosynthesis lipoprotein
VLEQRTYDAWGTTLKFVVDDQFGFPEGLGDTFTKVTAFVDHVNQIFSTYIDNSQVSLLHHNKIQLDQSHQDLQTIWRDCLKAREITDGAFDPWALDNGFDPSGIVKGWAAQEIATIFSDAGFKHIQIDASGDLYLKDGESSELPWAIGVKNPDAKEQVLRIFNIWDGAIATSGNYERGEHIRDPFNSLPAIGARSATVIGPSGGLCDALATALNVSGRNGSSWFLKPELQEYSCWVIDRHSEKAWGYGPAI